MRLGVIGLGGAAMQMLPSLMTHPRIRLAGCADPNHESRRRFADDFDATPYADAEGLCADPAIDAVYIASPHQWHRAQAVLAAQAGKHIVVEKPMALSLDDCEAMDAAARRNGVHLVVGHTHSFNAPIRKMREIISSGELGYLALINSFSYGNFLYRPRRPEELQTTLGGGIIFNQVPHQVDVVRYLGGGMVRSVRSMTWKLDPERSTEGSHATFLQFECGAVATIVYSSYDHFDSDEWHCWVGELGDLRQPDTHGAARAALQLLANPGQEAALKSSRSYAAKPAIKRPDHHPHCGVTIVSCSRGDMRPSPRGVTVYGAKGKEEIAVPLGPAFPDKAPVFDELIDAIDHNHEPVHNGRWGKATMEASLAVLESARFGREVMLQHQVPLIGL